MARSRRGKRQDERPLQPKLAPIYFALEPPPRGILPRQVFWCRYRARGSRRRLLLKSRHISRSAIRISLIAVDYAARRRRAGALEMAPSRVSAGHRHSGDVDAAGDQQAHRATAGRDASPMQSPALMPHASSRHRLQRRLGDKVKWRGRSMYEEHGDWLLKAGRCATGR